MCPWRICLLHCSESLGHRQGKSSTHQKCRAYFKKHYFAQGKAFNITSSFHVCLGELLTWPWLICLPSYIIWTEGESLSTEITPKHGIEIVMLCSQKDFSCLENVSSVTQMCFSKPWNFLLWKYVESTEFLKKIIIPWIWLCWKSTQELQSCFLYVF